MMEKTGGIKTSAITDVTMPFNRYMNRLNLKNMVL